jgi:hypothetical protein
VPPLWLETHLASNGFSAKTAHSFSFLIPSAELVIPPADPLLAMDHSSRSAAPGAITAPTNASPPAAHCPGGTNDPDHEFNATHVSTTLVDSTNEPNLHHAQGNPPTGFGDATPHLATDRNGRHPPAADRIVCPTVTNETQHTLVTGCQYQSTCSNNTDNPAKHRLSAVSNIAAAGPDGESGP